MASDRVLSGFKQFYSGSRDPAWLMAPSGDILELNDALKKILGFDNRALTQNDLGGLFSPEAIEKVAEALELVSVNPDETVRRSVALQHSDRSTCVLNCVFRKILDEDGTVAAILGSGTFSRKEELSLAAEERPRTAKPKPNKNAKSFQNGRQGTNIAPWHLNADTGKIWAADNFYTMLGFEPGEVELSSQWIRSRIHEEDLAEAVSGIEALTNGESDSYVAEYRLRRKDGNWLWMQSGGLRITQQQTGRDPIICGSFVDISKRTANADRLAEALEEAEASRALVQYNEETHRVATESGGIAPWHIDPKTGDAWWSDCFYRILGYEINGFPKTRDAFVDLIHPEDAPAAIASMAALRNGDSDVYHADFRLRRKDGSWQWCGSTARLVTREELGLHPLICGSMKDISTRKENEARLEAALAAELAASAKARKARDEVERKETLLRIATEGGGVATWYYDTGAEISWWSDHFYTLTGHPIGSKKMTGEELKAMVHPEDAPELWAQFNAVAEGRKTAMNIDFRMQHNQGHWIWCHSMARLLPREADNQPPLMVGSTVDISERKEHEQKLKDALRDAQDTRRAAEMARAAAQEKEEIFRVSSESGNVVPWTRSSDSSDSWFADNLAGILGYSDGTTFDSVSFGRIIHPDDLPKIIAAFAAIDTGETDIYAQDFRAQRADGSWCWLTSKGRKIDRSGLGLPLVVCGSLSSIEHLKDNETRLAEAASAAETARSEAQASEDMLRASASCGDIGPWNVCPETGECWMMDVTYRMFGYQPGEFVPDDEGWRNLIHPDDLDGANIQMGNLVMGKCDVYDVEHRIRHKDGKYHWYRGIARKIDRSAQGLPYLIAGTTTRIEHLKENELRLAEAAGAAKRARDRLNTLADNAPGALFEYHRNSTGALSFLYFSAKLPDILGTDHAKIKKDGDAIFANIHPDDIAEVLRKIEVSSDGDGSLELRFRLNHPTRGLRWILASSLPFAQPDGTVIWFGNLFDTTEQHEIEARAAEAAKAVERAHARLSSIADNAPAGIFEFRRYPNGDGDFPYTSAHFEELIGFTRSEIELLKLDCFKNVHPEDWPEMMASMEESTETLQQWSHRFRLNHPQRGQLWLAGSSTPKRQSNGTIVWVGVIYDVTKDVEREAELRRAHQIAEEMRARNERQALHDVLTGLPNRRFFDQTLSDRLAIAETGDGPKDCVLVRIDIDHFKYVNDTLGHEAGDAVLLHVGEVLRESTRENDFCARIGGDEFSVVLAPGSTAETAETIIARIQWALTEPLTYKGRLCTMRASFGVAHVDDSTKLGPEIHSFADAALYRAKEKGRNRMEFFTPALHQDILNDRRLASEIHDALANDEFVPFFQPQVSAKNGTLTGIETLVRWNHPERGLLAPDGFLGVAGQLRVVPEIDRIMMEKSDLALKRWQQDGLVIPKISFNVSSGRMQDPAIVSGAEAIALGDTKVAFELLESILVEEESDEFKFHLDRIREAGIDIEIDDFGSGHASIIGLMQISPTALKIDRRIVTPVALDTRSRSLVRAIVEIAETLGINTVAEGVETLEQVHILRDIGCDVLQGYYFSKPLSEDSLRDFVLGFDGAEKLRSG